MVRKRVTTKWRSMRDSYRSRTSEEDDWGERGRECVGAGRLGPGVGGAGS